jgi:glycosyltransferase involved in cell wall biosynthesis
LTQAAAELRVLFDVSRYVASGAEERSGIPRYIENVAAGLHAAGVDLGLCACEALPDLPAAVDLRGESMPLLGPRPLLRSLNRWAGRVRRTRLRPAGGVVSALRAGAQLCAGPFAPAATASYDILHFPVYLPVGLRPPSRSRVFLTVYDLIPVRHPEWFPPGKGAYIRRALGRAVGGAYVVCISEATRHDLLETLPIDPARVFVTPLAASPVVFYPCPDMDAWTTVRRRYELPEPPYLLSLSTLEPRKNLDHLVRCFARLIREGRMGDLSLVLVGAKGWDYEPIFRAAGEDAAVRGRVYFPGYIPDADLAPVYSQALAFIYPSLYEGFGLPPLEAMQCGVPVIVSDRPSLPEIVGDAGVLLDPADADGLCAWVERLYHDTGLRHRLAQQSLERSRTFSWTGCVRRTLDAYRTALANGQ